VRRRHSRCFAKSSYYVGAAGRPRRRIGSDDQPAQIPQQHLASGARTQWADRPRPIGLVRWRAHGRSPIRSPSALHRSAVALIHEATHIAGVGDEQVTDCYAMRSLDWFAWRLGAAPDFARELQADEWAWYAQHAYFLPSCVQD
jgi:hypothetical protein